MYRDDDDDDDDRSIGWLIESLRLSNPLIQLFYSSIYSPSQPSILPLRINLSQLSLTPSLPHSRRRTLYSTDILFSLTLTMLNDDDGCRCRCRCLMFLPQNGSVYPVVVVVVISLLFPCLSPLGLPPARAANG